MARTNHEVGQATFTILRHLGFQILWDGVAVKKWSDVISLGFTHDTYLSVNISADTTTVSREIALRDLWEDVPGILVAALAAWDFLVEPI